MPEQRLRRGQNHVIQLSLCPPDSLRGKEQRKRKQDREFDVADGEVVVDVVVIVHKRWVRVSGIAAGDVPQSVVKAETHAELTASQKDQYFGELLATAEGGATAPRTPFVVLMKRLTIFGYYTSELGATTELHQHIAVAQYEPAAVVKPGDRADSGIPGATYWFNAS